MVDVLTSSFYIKAPAFDRETFERYSTELFDKWDRQIGESLRLTNYSLTLVIEEGSINGKGKVAAGLAALYFGIAQYGGFVTGLETIYAQSTYITNALFSEAKTTFNVTGQRGN